MGKESVDFCVRRGPRTPRHTGASRDLAPWYRTFEKVQRRDRWKSADAVQRYDRTHQYFATEQAQSEEVRRLGREILASRKARPEKARD